MSCAAERIQFTVLYCGTEEKEPRFRIKAEKGRKKEYGKRETTEKKKTIQTETPVLCDYGDASADIVPAFVQGDYSDAPIVRRSGGRDSAGAGSRSRMHLSAGDPDHDQRKGIH